VKRTWIFYSLYALLPAGLMAQADVYGAKPCDRTVEYENHNMVDYTVKVRHLKGRILDFSDSPLPRACIAIFNSDHSRLLQTAESDDGGNFAVDKIPAGKYWLVVKDQQRAFCAASAKVEIGRLMGKETLLVHMKPRGIDTCSYCEGK